MYCLLSLTCFNSRDGAIDSYFAVADEVKEVHVSIPEMVRLIGKNLKLRT